MANAPEKFSYPISDSIREMAMALPDTTEGTSCVNRAFKAGGKNFAFLGEKPEGCGLRLKLSDSVPEIEKRSERQPDRYEVGKGGWVMLRFPADAAPDNADLESWIVESFCLLAPKKTSAKLENR
ncbi:MAG: MmcQ/YjbR family DNA-binding protein [Actinomycetia bacterium]|nr:MmcQ/YjbR family DNA-binding protein [Actinomycetes bacterium]MCP4957756.1 MmcQ/YjbR family DNA-binding protein [Actinomycetes bacterium]